MSMIDDIKKGGYTTLALGAGVISLLPALLPVAARGVRPLLNSAIQGGLVCLEKGQEAVAEIHRVLDHAAAQAKAEAHAHTHTAGSAGHGAMAASGSAGSYSSHTAYAPRPATPAAGPESKPIMAANGEPDPEVMG